MNPSDASLRFCFDLFQVLKSMFEYGKSRFSPVAFYQLSLGLVPVVGTGGKTNVF